MHHEGEEYKISFISSIFLYFVCMILARIAILILFGSFAVFVLGLVVWVVLNVIYGLCSKGLFMK